MAIPCTIHHHKRDGRAVMLDGGRLAAAIVGGNAVHVEIVGNIPGMRDFY